MLTLKNHIFFLIPKASSQVVVVFVFRFFDKQAVLFVVKKTHHSFLQVYASPPGLSPPHILFRQTHKGSQRKAIFSPSYDSL